MSVSINNKTAIITGASNGIGLAIARQFALAGASVMLADKNEDALLSQIKKLQEDAPNAKLNLRYFAGDLRQNLTMANLLSATIDAFEQVDILVNAARVVLPSSNQLDPKHDNFDAQFKQNVLANLRLSQMIAKRFIKQTQGEADISSDSAGVIINLSSIATDMMRDDMMAYSVCCAAVNQMTRALAVSLAGNRIRVNGIAIGSVESESLSRLLLDNDDLRGKVIEATPLGRIAEAGEVAEVAQFLASSSANFMTGQILTVDGGRTLLDPLK